MTTEKFHWTTPSGEDVVLPRMNQIKAGVLRRHRAKDGLDMGFSIMEDVASDSTMALIDDLEVDDLNRLLEAWQAGVTPGESSRS